jgi:hypothetical protein
MFNLDIPLVEKNLYQFTIYKIKIFVLRVLLRNISVTVKFDMGLFKSHWQFLYLHFLSMINVNFDKQNV